ncbi:hypothetical protein [Sutterella sp.]|uniref:hypothetical protein n=1 Tax=Sutterella sp. TaxID=1981025 RepID=UPI0026E0E278|nr:hypothetical protein [Sutterella sp.]MDO5532260.1 hypothetical protein [Sutterella sp.]
MPRKKFNPDEFCDWDYVLRQTRIHRKSVRYRMNHGVFPLCRSMKDDAIWWRADVDTVQRAWDAGMKHDEIVVLMKEKVLGHPIPTEDDLRLYRRHRVEKDLRETAGAPDDEAASEASTLNETLPPAEEKPAPDDEMPLDLLLLSDEQICEAAPARQILAMFEPPAAPAEEIRFPAPIPTRAAARPRRKELPAQPSPRLVETGAVIEVPERPTLSLRERFIGLFRGLARAFSPRTPEVRLSAEVLEHGGTIAGGRPPVVMSPEPQVQAKPVESQESRETPSLPEVPELPQIPSPAVAMLKPCDETLEEASGEAAPGADVPVPESDAQEPAQAEGESAGPDESVEPLPSPPQGKWFDDFLMYNPPLLEELAKALRRIPDLYVWGNVIGIINRPNNTNFQPLGSNDLMKRFLKFSETDGQKDTLLQSLAGLLRERPTEALQVFETMIHTGAGLPEIRRFATHPVIRPTGEPDFTTGFHPKEGLFVGYREDQWEECRNAVPGNDLDAVWNTFDELLLGFPFRSHRDMFGAITAILTAFMRPTLSETPIIHVIGDESASPWMDRLIHLIASVHTMRLPELTTVDENTRKRVQTAEKRNHPRNRDCLVFSFEGVSPLILHEERRMGRTGRDALTIVRYDAEARKADAMHESRFLPGTIEIHVGDAPGADSKLAAFPVFSAGEDERREAWRNARPEQLVAQQAAFSLIRATSALESGLPLDLSWLTPKSVRVWGRVCLSAISLMTSTLDFLIRPHSTVTAPAFSFTEPVTSSKAGKPGKPAKPEKPAEKPAAKKETKPAPKPAPQAEPKTPAQPASSPEDDLRLMAGISRLTRGDWFTMTDLAKLAHGGEMPSDMLGLFTRNGFIHGKMLNGIKVKNWFEKNRNLTGWSFDSKRESEVLPVKFRVRRAWPAARR